MSINIWWLAGDTLNITCNFVYCNHHVHRDFLITLHKSSTAHMLDTRWRSWLRHCATSRKVAGSIPDGVTGIFHWHNPSGRTMALGLTQPLTEMSTRNFSWVVKAAGAYGWQPYHLHVPTVLKSGNLNLLEPSGPVQGCNGMALPLSAHAWKVTFEMKPLVIERREFSFVFSSALSQSYMLRCCSRFVVPRL